MSNSQTPAEIKQHYIDKMGNELGSLFYALWNEVVWLHFKWGEYIEMFGTKSSRLELLNETAPSFFRMLQDMWWRDILLHLATITDPPKSAGKPNLTIRRLDHLVDDPKTAKMVKKQIDDVVGATDFCRDWRNRRIAHRDFDLAISENPVPLKPANRKKIEDVLRKIVAVMNTIEMHYLDSETYYGAGVNPTRWTKALLYVIDDGLKVRNERRDRRQRGEYNASDFLPRDI